jgi:hypothetical protein
MLAANVSIVFGELATTCQLLPIEADNLPVYPEDLRRL